MIQPLELVVPPLTPFSSDLAIDEGRLQRQIDYIIADCGATRIVAAGVEAQEYQFLSWENRKRLIELTISFTDARLPVIAGISHPSFIAAIELAHFAERCGASALQILAPSRPAGGAATEVDLLAYFQAIAQETKLPLVLYLNPGPGADVSIAATIALAKLPRVVMIKESSRDLARVSRLIVEIEHAGHARYLTTMQMLLITLTLGGAGATMPPPAAEIAGRIIRAFLAGNHDLAAKLQLQFALFPSRWMHLGLTPTMKAAMSLIGQPLGLPYPPFAALDEVETEALRKVLSTTTLAERLLTNAHHHAPVIV